METVTFEDFKKLDLKVGKILNVQDHPDADKLYVMEVDIGEGIRKIVAGIKPYYTKDQLLNKLVIIVVNLQPRTIRGVESQGMLLAGLDDKILGILTVDRELKPGTRIT